LIADDNSEKQVTTDSSSSSRSIFVKNTSANVMIFDEVNGDVWEIDLLVKQTLSDGDFSIYMKKDDRTKK